MKYTIELTDNQKKQMDLLCELAHRYIGFNPKLEPVEYSSESEVEKYGIQAYNKGFEDGKKWAIDENAKDHQGYYDKGYRIGYNEGIAKQKDPNFVPLQKCPTQLEDCKAYNLGLEDGYKGYKYLEKWFGDTCFYDDEDNLFPEYKRRQADTCCLEDIITDVGFSEVLNRIKAYEEKKRAEEEDIKVGDEVDVNGELAIVTRINPNDYDVFYLDGITGEPFKTSCKKTGRHFGEVSQLLDKLRGEEE